MTETYRNFLETIADASTANVECFEQLKFWSMVEFLSQNKYFVKYQVDDYYLKNRLASVSFDIICAIYDKYKSSNDMDIKSKCVFAVSNVARLTLLFHQITCGDNNISYKSLTDVPGRGCEKITVAETMYKMASILAEFTDGDEDKKFDKAIDEILFLFRDNDTFSKRITRLYLKDLKLNGCCEINSDSVDQKSDDDDWY